MRNKKNRNPLATFNKIKTRRQAIEEGWPNPHPYDYPGVKRKPLAFVSRDTIRSWTGKIELISNDADYFKVPGEVWDYFADLYNNQIRNER